MTVLLLVLMGVLLALAFPIFWVLLLPTILILIDYFPHLPTFIVAQRMISGVSPFVLVAVPMFIFMAEIIKKGESANRLIALVLTFVGYMAGGLAQAYTVSCMIFGAVSGSTQATLAALGGPMYPMFLKKGYNKNFTLALLIVVNDTAVLIPPSVPMILYGVVTGSSVAELFVSGIIPGIFLGLSFMGYNYAYAKMTDLPREEKANFREIAVATKRSLWALGFPVIIIGGIYAGLMSPTEAAAAAAVYAIVVECFIYKKVKLSDIPACALSTGHITGVIYVIVAAGMALSWLITMAQVPQVLKMALMGPNPSAIEVMLWCNLFFFVALMFVSPASAIFVLTPLFYETAMAAGVDPIHLGVLITLNCAIGSATPPFGVDIFTACAIFKEPYKEVIRGVWPFVILEVIVLLILTYFPTITLVLRDLVFR